MCGTADNALSANDSTKFCGCTYQQACADIRSGLMGYQDIGVNADCNILLCVANDKVGASSCKKFTFNPVTGVVCACCFSASDICLNINGTTRWGNIPYIRAGQISNIKYIGLFYAGHHSFFSKIYSSSLSNKQCDVYQAIVCATGTDNGDPVKTGDKLGIVGSIYNTNNCMCNVTYMTTNIEGIDYYTIYYNGGNIVINSACECTIGYINIAFTPDYNFGKF